MKLVILSQKSKVCEKQAREVILPGYDGELSVWDFHQSFLCRLRKGYVKITEAGAFPGKKPTKFFIKDGVAKMLGNTLTILVQTI